MIQPIPNQINTTYNKSMLKLRIGSFYDTISAEIYHPYSAYAFSLNKFFSPWRIKCSLQHKMFLLNPL